MPTAKNGRTILLGEDDPEVRATLRRPSRARDTRLRSHRTAKKSSNAFAPTKSRFPPSCWTSSCRAEMGSKRSGKSAVSIETYRSS